MTQYLLGENKGDEMAYMHGFGRGAPACVQVKRLLVFIGIKDLIHVSKGKRRKGNRVILLRKKSSANAPLETLRQGG